MNKREFVEQLIPFDPWVKYPAIQPYACPLCGWCGTTPLQHFEDAHEELKGRA